jgi:hypothetical protein
MRRASVGVFSIIILLWGAGWLAVRGEAAPGRLGAPQALDALTAPVVVSPPVLAVGPTSAGWALHAHTATPSATLSATASITPGVTLSVTSSVEPSATLTGTAPTGTASATATITATQFITLTCTGTLTTTCVVTVTLTSTPTETPTPTRTPTPSRTRTPTLTPTPTPPVSNLPLVLKMIRRLENGDWESGELLLGWCAEGALPVAVLSEMVHGGRYAVRLGDPSYDNWGGCPTGEAAVYQTFQAPAEGHPRLRIWYRILSYDTYEFDYLAIDLRRESDGQVERAWLDGGYYWTQGKLWDSLWREADIALDNYRGELVQVRIANVMSNGDGYYNTWSYVDDVSLQMLP